MMSNLPDDWTDEDQDDLDRGESSWDDDQWSDTEANFDAGFLTRLHFWDIIA
jgi:hypothetical protein